MSIVVTGAGGFIGSQVALHLDHLGEDIVLVDDWSMLDKVALASGCSGQRVPRAALEQWLSSHEEVHQIIHLGARTDTAEQDKALLDRLNLDYSKMIWQICTQRQIPLIYASSAATYGLAETGFDDAPAGIPHLQPLNPYGQSKQDFDLWVLKQASTPPRWAGFKFFNVYGPHERYKGRMASVVWHTYQQIKSTGAMRLFRSHRPDIADGEQSRDFVYVDDVVAVLEHFRGMYTGEYNGIYNLGTGTARTFYDLARATFAAQGLAPSISFIDTPIDIRDTYQYYTCADLRRLRQTGYQLPFIPLEEGVQRYVHYLASMTS